MTIERFSIALLLLPGLALAAVVPPADLVLFHGNIHTQDSNRSVVQALAIRGNTIVAVGTAQFVSGLIGPKTQMLDLARRTALPGIIDAHTHPAEGAQDLDKCNLHDQELTPPEIQSEVATCLKNTTPGSLPASLAATAEANASAPASVFEASAIRNLPHLLLSPHGRIPE